jgi:hypothetical protein
MHITTEQLAEVTGVNYYDGSILKSKFAYKFFRKDVSPLGNIVAFVSRMSVQENLIDLEDALTNDYIYSDKAINFLIELPGYSIEASILFQRLFNTALGSLLSVYIPYNVHVDGDDIMVESDQRSSAEDTVEWKKASVSIATLNNGAGLIHTGINIEAGLEAPAFAYSTKLGAEETNEFIEKAIGIFNHTVQSVFVASTKLIS